MALLAASPSSMGLPAELRVKVLRELLCHSEPLRDIPTIVARNGNPEEVPKYMEDDLESGHVCTKHEWMLANRNHFGSARRFKLFPNILRVCKQIHTEGSPLLYDDRAIGISFLNAFDFVGKCKCWVETHNRSYCMGGNSLEAALAQWPALKKFQNFEYTIYIGPGYDQTAKKYWTGRDRDIKTMQGMYINDLTIRYFEAASDDSYNGQFFVPHSMLPYHVLASTSIDFKGDLPEDFDESRAWITQEVLKGFTPTWYKSAHGLLEFMKLLLDNEQDASCCDACGGHTERLLTMRDIIELESDFEVDIDDWLIGEFYKDWMVGVKICQRFLNRARESHKGCSHDSLRRKRSCNPWLVPGLQVKAIKHLEDELLRLHHMCMDGSRFKLPYNMRMEVVEEIEDS